MSDPTTISLTVTVSVAVLAIAGGIVNERYKRHKDMVAVAAILHADISALLKITSANGTIEHWETAASVLEGGQNIGIPQMHIPEPSQGPIFHAYLDKIGLLKVEDARDVILFYEFLMGIRVILKNLVSGTWDAQPQAAAIKAVQVRQGLGFWSQCKMITDRLLPALEQTSNQQFVWLHDLSLPKTSL